jgi:mannose-1-phosphate guanylyltransferase/mannose-6-phosphate isomerase
LSRSLRPKQFLPLFDGESLFQNTLSRFSGSRFAAPIVIANAEHRFLVGEQMATADTGAGTIVLEPVGRNTAAPAAVAALTALEADPDALVLLAPSDHLVRDADEFARAVDHAIPAAKAGRIVTFGIRPSEPNTGYGYIRLKEGEGPVRPVAAFVEKPDLERARAFLASGDHVWNAGIFLFSAATMIAEFEKHCPEVLARVRDALDAATPDLDFLRLGVESFSAVPNISIDYAIMEKSDRISCVPTDPGWSDLGSWSAVWEALDKSEEGNSTLGEAMFVKSRDSLVVSDGALVSVVGLDHVMVVATKGRRAGCRQGPCPGREDGGGGTAARGSSRDARAPQAVPSLGCARGNRPWRSLPGPGNRDQAGREHVAAKPCQSRGALGGRLWYAGDHHRRRDPADDREPVGLCPGRGASSPCEPRSRAGACH